MGPGAPQGLRRWIVSLLEASSNPRRQPDGLLAASPAAPPLAARAWYAWADRMPPGPGSLHVVGQVLAPTPCYRAELHPAASPGGDAGQLVLDVALAPIRRVCPDVPTWIEARYDRERYAGAYREVAIRGGGELLAVVPVEEVG